MDDLLRPNQSFPNASASGPADRPNTLDVQDANTDIFDIDDFDSPTELAAIQAGCDLSKMRAIGFSQNTLANTGTLTHNHNRARGPGLIAAADLSPSPHERPRSTLPNFAATGAGGSDEREVFESAPPASVTGAHSSAVVHLKRPQSRPLSSAGVVAGDSSPARPRARTFAKRSVEENPNIRRLEELYRDIAAQKELTARLGSSLRLHADEFDDSLSGRSQSQSLSSTPPLCFLPLEQSHSSSPSTSHSRDSPIQFVSAHIPPPPPGSAVVSTVATSSSIPRSASASSPDSPLSSSLSRPGGPLHPSGRKPSIDSPSPLAAPPLETRTLRPIADAANKNCVSSREPNYECETAEEALEETYDQRAALRLSLPAPPTASASAATSSASCAGGPALTSVPSSSPASASASASGGIGRASTRSQQRSIQPQASPSVQQPLLSSKRTE